jgi:hypothetical protein
VSLGTSPQDENRRQFGLDLRPGYRVIGLGTKPLLADPAMTAKIRRLDNMYGLLRGCVQGPDAGLGTG